MVGIGFGTWAWGNKLIWNYSSSKDDACLKETFYQAIKGGLSIIDTADSYGTGTLRGRSETLIGKFLQKISSEERKKITIATKLAPFPWRQGRQSIKKAFLESKKRLQGNVDRVQLHWSTARYAPWQEIQLLDGLGDLWESGLIKEIGLSNIGPDRLLFIYERLEKRKIKIKSIQTQFSLLTPHSLKEKKLKDICNELNIEMLAYSPLALGILGVAANATPKPATFLRQRLFNQLLPKTNDIRHALHEIGCQRKSTQVATALNWCRSHGAKPIPGLRNPSQAREAVEALKWSLNKQEKEYLDTLRAKNLTRMPNNPFQSS